MLDETWEDWEDFNAFDVSRFILNTFFFFWNTQDCFSHFHTSNNKCCRDIFPHLLWHIYHPRFHVSVRLKTLLLLSSDNIDGDDDTRWLCNFHPHHDFALLFLQFPSSFMLTCSRVVSSRSAYNNATAISSWAINFFYVESRFSLACSERRKRRKKSIASRHKTYSCVCWIVWESSVFSSASWMSLNSFQPSPRSSYSVTCCHCSWFSF